MAAFIINGLVVVIFGYVLLHFIPNIQDKLTRQFWGFNLLFAFARTINAFLVEKHVMSHDFYSLLSATITASIFGYFIWFLNKKYGVRYKAFKELQKVSDNIDKELYPYIIPAPDRTLGIRVNVIDIDAIIKSATNEWKYLDAKKRLKYRLWGGELIPSAFVAIECYAEDDVNLGEHCHAHIETIHCISGSMLVKNNIERLKSGDTVGIMPYDTHLFFVEKGTHSVSYFTKHEVLG